MTDHTPPRADLAPEWHLAKLLGFICPNPTHLRGLKNNDAMHMEVHLRVGDVRAAHASVLSCFGSDGKEEARWIEDTESACPHCGGSGHKDDIKIPSREERKAILKEMAQLDQAAGLLDLPAPPSPPDLAPTGNTALVEAVRELLAGLQGSHRAGNNRQVSIQGDDGEKCWIVHSDRTHALECALDAALQPAAPQPTPKVEAEGDIAMIGNLIRRRGSDAHRLALDRLRAALARGSVAQPAPEQGDDV